MLSSVLPWEWILENVLDLKEFSSPCLKELISYIPHIEDPRCSKLLQKVALRYLEEIVLIGKVDACAITLIKNILKAQGGSSLRRIHSLKESVENNLILRVETEVVLANVRYPGRNGGRNWKAFEDAVEEVFPESSREAFKLERRKELMSILLVDEHQDDMCERMLRKYPLKELLKDLLQFIESKRTLLKTKFLDQLVKDVERGSYVPSSASPSSEDGLSSPTHVPKDSHSKPEVPEILLRRDKADLPYLQTEPTLPNILLGEPIERLTAVMKETSADMHTNRRSPSSPVSLVDGGRTTMHEVQEQRDRTEDKSTGADKVPMEDALEADMTPSMIEVDKVARELTSQMDEFVDNMDKFAADIHKVAVNSTDQAFGFVNTTVSNEEQRVDPTSFLTEYPVVLKRSASDKLPGSTRKSKRSCLDGNPGTGRDIDGGFPAKVGISVRDDDNTGRAVDESIEVDYSASANGLEIRNEKPFSSRFKAFLRQSTQEQRGRRPSASTGIVRNHVSCGHDTCCALCRRGGVLLSCHECSVVVHERCLDEIGMGKAVDEPYWFCPSCVEQLTMEVLQGVKAEAEIARQKAAVFVHARGKHSGERRSSSKSVDGLDQMTNSSGAFLVQQESVRSKDGNDQAPGLRRDPKSNAQNGVEAPQAREMERLEGCLSPTTSQLGGKRYHLRPRALPSAREENNHNFDEKEVGGPEPLLIPSSPTANSNAERSTSNVAAPGAGRSTPAIEELFATSIPSREHVERDGVTNLDGLPSNEGQAADVGCSGNEQNLLSSEELTPAGDPQCNIPVPVVEEGDGHDGDLEEDIHRHQDAVESSKADQTSDHPSPVGERTPPRKGRYRGRWKIPGVRRKNLPWSETEVAVLREGVKRYSSSGFGFQWKNILEYGHGQFDPSRTTVDLKDKWRNLNKAQDRSSSSDVSV